MNKVRKRIATSLLVSSMSLALSLSAATTTASSQPNQAEATTTPFVSPVFSALSRPDDAQFIKVGYESSAQDSLRVTFQHHLARNGYSVIFPKEMLVISPEKIVTNPLFYFKRLNKWSQLKMLRKPVQASTVIELLLPRQAAEEFGKLPVLFVETDIDMEGIGKSDLVWFPYQHEIADRNDNVIIDSKGLKGQFTFSDKQESLTTQLSLLGFTVTETTGKGAFSLGETTLSGTFDGDLMPTQMSLRVPTFKFSDHEDENIEVNLQDFAFNVDFIKTSNGLKLVEVDAQMGHFDFRDFRENDKKFGLDNLTVRNDFDEQGDVINNTVQAQIGKLRLPKALTLGEEFELSYAGQLNLRRLDAAALLALQTTAHKLSQQDNSRLEEEIKEKFREVLPQMLAKSPEIALTETVETSKGNVQGSVSVSIDGTKVTSLENPLALIPALHVRASISIDKTLLEYALTILENESPSEARDIREQIPMFVEMKFLVETAESYEFTAEFQNGQLTVNGERVDVSSFLSDFLSQMARQVEEPAESLWEEGMAEDSAERPHEEARRPEQRAYRRAAPVNDNFADALELIGTSSSTGSNVGATGESGDPTDGNSVWWKWTAPSNIEVTVDTCRSNFDTMLSVFTGPAVDNLTQVASDDDSCDSQSRVTFTASFETTYYIAVTGYHDRTGAVVINLVEEGNRAGSAETADSGAAATPATPLTDEAPQTPTDEPSDEPSQQTMESDESSATPDNGAVATPATSPIDETAEMPLSGELSEAMPVEESAEESAESSIEPAETSDGGERTAEESAETHPEARRMKPAETPPVGECSSACKANFEECLEISYQEEGRKDEVLCRQILDNGDFPSCVPGCTIPVNETPSSRAAPVNDNVGECFSACKADFEDCLEMTYQEEGRKDEVFCRQLLDDGGFSRHCVPGCTIPVD